MEQKKKIVIGLVGETGSGKDTVANYLAEKYGVKLMRFADPLNDTLKIYFDEISKQDQQWLAMVFRERFGNDILGRALRKKIESGEGIISVNGLRMPEDYDFVKSFANSFVIYITANQKLRWERVYHRGEKSDDSVDFAKFQEIEKAKTEVHIPEIGAKADFLVRNEKDLAYLLSEVDKIMAEISS
jgi:dephospho-CoA kinase